MSNFRIDEKCNGCLACVEGCPAKALSFTDEGNRRSILHSITRCARCGHCWRICPQQAIRFEDFLGDRWEAVVSMDLVRCSICNEPIYTPGYGEALAARLGQEMEPLCPRHRSGLAMNAWREALAQGNHTGDAAE